ncbi:hypothetical protein [Rhizobium sp. CIAT894]|uniref:hypothetical protein n=1 Tax=Rhizobium sp. CIAT894 TaxID=2020312 RepID=UPI000F73C09C|nr:hypothetical protein [Rhizobium sp. CIAT894]
MSRKTANALAFLLIMTSCHTPSTSPRGPALGDSTEDKIKSRILVGAAACHFVPTLQTIESLIVLFGGYKIPVIDMVVDAICSTVDKSKAAGFVVAPSAAVRSFGSYKGVAIQGRIKP